ncbi:MAG: hypothetical protein AAGG01_04650 [Planctomycetota bacterium]
MRALALATAVLTCGAVLIWLGSGVDGDPADAVEPVVLTAGDEGPEDRPTPQAAHPVASTSAVASVGSAPESGSRASREVADLTLDAQPPTSIDLILRSPAALANGPPEVYLLRARANFKGLTGVKTFGGKSAFSKERWRWSRAVQYGERVSSIPPWGAPGPDGVEARTWMPKPGRLDRVFAKMGDRVSVGALTSSGIVIDFADAHETVIEIVAVHEDGGPARDVPVVFSSLGEYQDLRTAGRPISDLPATDEDGSLRVMQLGASFPKALVLGDALLSTTGFFPRRIELPAVGTIDVAFDYAEDHPLHGRSQPEGLLKISSAAPEPFALGKHWEVTTRIENGKARLWPVALGKRFRLEVEEGLGQATVKVAGPTEAGEVVHVTMSEAMTPILKVRLVDDAGRPVANEMAHVRAGTGVRRRRRASGRLSASGNRLGWSVRVEEVTWSSKTNQEGVAQFLLGETAAGDVLGPIDLRTGHLHLRLSEGLIGSATVDEPLVGGPLDIGSVTLRPVPHLVSGRVVDGSGEPVERAVVMVEERRRVPAELDWAGTRAERLDYTDSEGRFTIRWLRDPDESTWTGLTLVAKDGKSFRRSNGILSRAKAGERGTFESVPFRPGDRDVVLVIERAGGIQVDLTQVEPAELQGLRFLLRPASSPESELVLRPGERSELKHRRPGRYSFCLRLGKEEIPIAEDLIVEPGETLVDPRLNPFLFDAHVARRRLFVEGEDGSTIPTITVSRVARGVTSKSNRVDAKNGAFDVLAYLRTPPACQWLIEADGYSPVTLESLSEGQNIKLPSTIRVTVQLVGADLPGVPVRMSAALKSPARSSGGRIPISFDVLGRGTFEAPGPGVYLLGRAMGRRGSVPGPKTDSWVLSEFTVPDDGGVVEIGPR